jgi:hypothetical protein
MTTRTTMRKLTAIVALLCGAASPNADTSRFYTSYCSAGFETPAVISQDGDVRIGNQLQKVSDTDLRLAAIILDDGKKQSVIIFRDRVFWPCEISE